MKSVEELTDHANELGFLLGEMDRLRRDSNYWQERYRKIEMDMSAANAPRDAAKYAAEGPLAFECTCGTGGLFVNAMECKEALDQHKSVCFAPLADASKAKERNEGICECGFVTASYGTKKEAIDALDVHRSLCQKQRDINAVWIEAAKKKAEDAVNHPSHYQGKVETIDAIESACAGIGPDAFKGYLTGNIVKYMSRWSRKGGAQDLKKAAWYLAKLLEVVKP